MVLAVLFIASCAGPPVQYRHEETFYSPYGRSAIKIGAAGDITRDGTFEKGFVSYHPFNEGAIATLMDEEETVENYPNLQPKCNNYKGQLKKTVKRTYRHQVIVRGQVVYAWNDNNPNWWAVGLTNLAGCLINRGVDAAFLATMMPTGGGDINLVNQQQQLQKQKAVGKGGQGGAGGAGGLGGSASSGSSSSSAASASAAAAAAAAAKAKK